MKVLVVVGTRPEAIKMAPLITRLRAESGTIRTEVCATAQHREMLDQVLQIFEIEPTYDLDLMRPNQNLFDLTGDIITGFRDVLEVAQPDIVLVHGDTTTSFAAALAGFYAGVPVGHVEAGLRTYNRQAPFPEELNRQLVGRLAVHHFAPTERARKNLIEERTDPERILVTGNTVIDALLDTVQMLDAGGHSPCGSLRSLLDPDADLVLVTTHRRENLGENLEDICTAIDRIGRRPGTQVVLPVHPNPRVAGTVHRRLGDAPGVVLIDPLPYTEFVWLMNRSRIVLTDSGGIQEEAPSLGKPVFVMREDTERPEAIEAGTAELVGTDIDRIVSSVVHLLDDPVAYRAVSERHNPYGDGHAAERIIDYLANSVDPVQG